VHPFGDLSAYLDGALSTEDQTSVQAHLDTCAICRTRLAELRGTARLIAALPMPVPTRSLVPRVSVPIWLAPLRTFTTFASGAAIFLFLATAILTSFPRGVGTGAGSAAAPAANTVSAPQASPGLAADSATGDPAKFQAAGPSPAPIPATSPATSQERRSAQGASPTPPDALPVGRQEAPASPSTDLAFDARAQAASDVPGLFTLTSPWLWLTLGLLFAAVSFILSRRLRST
jgi:anti-sigma factor RsiW